MADLIVALDYHNADSALSMAESLRGTVSWVKVGLELFTAEGPRIVLGLKDMGFKVFLDLKFFDIPNTVQGATRSATRLGVDMISIHALGGERMAHAALTGCAEGAALGQKQPYVFAITMLTSMAEEEFPLDVGSNPSVLALDLARKAKQYGLRGVVCSGLEVERIKAECGSDFMCLTPGIRPMHSSSDDQRRIVTPSQAVENGSQFLVVGRPVTGANNPEKSAAQIVQEMESANSRRSHG